MNELAQIRSDESFRTKVFVFKGLNDGWGKKFVRIRLLNWERFIPRIPKPQRRNPFSHSQSRAFPDRFPNCRGRQRVDRIKSALFFSQFQQHRHRKDLLITRDIVVWVIFPRSHQAADKKRLNLRGLRIHQITEKYRAWCENFLHGTHCACGARMGTPLQQEMAIGIESSGARPYRINQTAIATP